jgi:hypothetical protein
LNEDFAWFLGYLASDGSIIRPTYRKKGDERHIGFTIHHKDKEVLQLVKKITSTNATVKEYPSYKSPQAQLNIYDRMDIIEKYGDVIKKNAPEDIEGFERHYIRGLIDGDGCLNYRENRNSFRINLTNNSFEIVNWVANTLSQKLGIEKKDPRFKSRENLYIIEWEGKVAKLIAWYLYHGEIANCALERKLLYYKKYVTNKGNLKGFFEALALNMNGQNISPATSYKDSLKWCKILQRCLLSFFGIRTTPITVNKGTKKYYELYVPMANTQGLLS